MVDCWVRSPSVATPPQTVDYFYGRISRQEAETFVAGSRDGLFLLRWCINHANAYGIAVYFHRKVHHYMIERLDDGRVHLDGGKKKYLGPVELIDYHRKKKAGLVTKLTCPCARPPEMMAPYFWFGVTVDDFNDACFAQGSRDPAVVASTMHTSQPWFHGDITREQGELCLQTAGLVDGLFLVREKRDGSFVVSLSHGHVVWHYSVHVRLTDRGQKLRIENGPPFDNLMDLVTYYHGSGGLFHRLVIPCVRPHYRPTIPPTVVQNLDRNLVYAETTSAATAPHQQQLLDGGVACYNGGESYDVSYDLSQRQPAQSSSYLSLRGTDCSAAYGDLAEDSEAMYVRTRRYLIDRNIEFDIRRSQLDLNDTLGSGQFGSVCRATYRIDGEPPVTVAVKTLKRSKQPSKQAELEKEAAIMAALDSPYIIRMIGLCKTDWMLILEYAPLGPLKDYLRLHKSEMRMANIVELMHQVAKGMDHLNSHSIIHRDLAARNILLVTKQHAKISDFGLSRDLTCRGKDYYQSAASEDERWPIKWYSPECLKTYKFDSKSDVWSYGVALWEATSYADVPYKGMDSRQYRRFIEEHRRLQKPSGCPVTVYGIMLHCWAHEKNDRPTFEQIDKLLSRITYVDDDDVEMTSDPPPDVLNNDNTQLKLLA